MSTAEQRAWEREQKRQLEQAGERVVRPVTAVGDRGHDAVRPGPQAEPDRQVTTSVAAGPASSSEVTKPRPQGPCAALGG